MSSGSVPAKPPKPIRVILCGKDTELAKHMVRAFIPEIEVVHCIASPEVACKDVPRLLSNTPPSTPSARKLGTQRYDRPIESILCLIDFYNELVGSIRNNCQDLQRGVPWLVGGYSEEEWSELSQRRPEDTETLGTKYAKKMTRLLKDIREESRGREDGLYVWCSPSMAGQPFGMSFYAEDLLREAMGPRQ